MKLPKIIPSSNEIFQDMSNLFVAVIYKRSKTTTIKFVFLGAPNDKFMPSSRPPEHSGWLSRLWSCIMKFKMTRMINDVYSLH